MMSFRHNSQTSITTRNITERVFAYTYSPLKIWKEV